VFPFGLFIAATSDPNDVDIVLVMSDDFNVIACQETER
jgi:hypothetical protein